MEVQAKLKFARISSQKCRLVADQIRGSMKLSPYIRLSNWQLTAGPVSWLLKPWMNLADGTNKAS